MTPIHLTKHHGLGNDFLVWLDGNVREGPKRASEWCDRRRGFGADGLLIAREITGDAATMVLFNADGSRAEMSGNGIRCFAQGVFGSRPGTYSVHTDAGLRSIEVTATDEPNTVMASVSMGIVTDLPEPARWSELSCDPMRPVAHLSLGNPHSVVGVEDVREVPLEMLGAIVAHVNLEIVEPGPEPHAVTMRVHERGAGITQACGTGACAVAVAAARWGLVPSAAPEILVHMDGGDATVRLHCPAVGEVTLVGPATYVGRVEITG